MGCRVSVEASDPLTTPAPETQGEGGEGEGRARGCCLSSSKVNESCKWRWGANSQSDSASQSFVVWVGRGVGGCTAFGWIHSHRQKPSVAPLSLSSFLSLPSVCDLGAGSEEKTQLRQGRGVRAGRERAREEVRTSLL